MKIRRISAAMLASVVAMVLFGSAVGSAQQLQSGALLTVQDSNGTVAAIYDSQIHSGNVHSSPCDAAAVVTDAYVLQGGSPTGCDNGDAFEAGQTPGSATITTSDGFTFTITTQYLLNSEETTYCTGSTVESVPVPSICANPDTGFLTVTNTSEGAFTGTITLSGVAQNPNGISSGDCPPGGVASDTFTGTLGGGGSVTLALSTDSSNCGGFNASQSATLSAKGTVIFHIGPDDYQIVGANNVGGETLTLDLVPVLQSSSNPGSTPSNTFSPGSLFASDNCDPYNSLSEAVIEGPSNPVCPEFHLSCSGNADCSTFAYEVTTHYTLLSGFDPLPGPPVFLKADGAICPPPGGFDANIFLSYTIDPTKIGGGGGISCFAPGYGPGSPQTVNVSLSGYAVKLYPPKPPAVTDWEESCLGLFCPIPVIWQEFDLNNNLVTTNKPPFFSGGFCKASTPLASCPANSVALQFVPLDCTTLLPAATAVRADALPEAVVFVPFPIFKLFPADTFVVNAIPLQKKFDDTCQVLELITIGTGGVQSTYSSYIHFD